MQSSVMLGAIVIGLGVGCSPGTLTVESGPTGDPPPPPPADAGPRGTTPDRELPPNPDAFFEDDPPPRMCLPDGSMTEPMLPGGTPDCPADKNREGCRCDVVGETGTCWPGLRVDRERGICRDGTTTCMPYDEFGGAWGPCEGYVLP